MWIGLDDTDSRDGGCTTFVCFTFISELYKKGYCLRDYPRLIRLNPQVPWKTRGNGAIAFHIGRNGKNETLFGKKGNRSLYFDRNATDKGINEKEIISLMENVLSKYAMLDAEHTNPAFVISSTLFHRNFYQKAVHELVSIDEAIKWVELDKGTYILMKNGRGIIGATAALSWNSSLDYTYEIITYREKKNWKTNRNVSADSVIEMDITFDSTFDNFDYENQYNSIVPHSPCPILYGIRGDDVEILPDCIEMIKSEEIMGWMIFISNQGTDDHVKEKKISDIQPYQSVQVRGTIASNPQRKQGGHVFFTLRDERGDHIDCAAYEPTKQFRSIIEQLTIGDMIIVFGGIREIPLTINIEKLQILSLTEVVIKQENPICPICKKHMRSKGKNQGYFCKSCKTKSDNPIMKKKQRVIQNGFYEVPVCARRHLSKPIKRI